MTLTALRDDALRSTPEGFAVLLGLPWIRSLPSSSLSELRVSIDGESVRAATADMPEWWFLQDRITILGDGPLAAGPHDVTVSFQLMIPYLQVGPDGPLSLPFRIARPLTLDAPAAVAASVIERESAHEVARDDALPEGWTLAASAFNWTPDVIRAERTAEDIAVGIVTDGVSSVIEIEPGQLWRSFPTPRDGDVDALRTGLEAAHGSVSIVGASLDDWVGSTRRTDAERLAFMLPQLHAAARVGAAGVRLPIGQAGDGLLRELLPVLHELDLVLFEEIQGQQTPDSPAARGAIETIARTDDTHLRLLVDISMLMPAVPSSYLDLLRSGGVPEALLQRLATDWRDPATNGAVIEVLRSGGVPPAVHTAFMNLLVRFGRSSAADLRDVLPLTGAFHLKFWDLDDTDGRVTHPIRDLGSELAGTPFTGTLCSEWGGHEWLDDVPADITRRHLALARSALREGARALA
ncbi:restriction endonuclease subunit R [Microbacterium pygmaeum]|uniref:Xylose isomerase-like TIM barrel n=1 Tax=Microbacterium pygmaeum TaxID=370764 RepID=A0A1G7VJ24_9MICO|nr:restriction endonuclease subunit R [Microbacterium pygmaeum]SDG59561.1 hypothetical protein SAMN04489810_0726 [Microbacterium pygmaeum]